MMEIESKPFKFRYILNDKVRSYVTSLIERIRKKKTYKKIRYGADEEKNRTLTAIKKHNNTNKRLCKYNRFAIFTPFFGNFKGIQNEFLFKKDDKVILLIGETHSLPDLEGFTRLSSVITDILQSLDVDLLEKSKSTLDFFIEITAGDHERYREMYDKLQSENRLNFDGYDFDHHGLGDELQTLRGYFSHFIPKNSKKRTHTKKNIRFHFSDYLQPISTSNDLEQLNTTYSAEFKLGPISFKSPDDESIRSLNWLLSMKQNTINLYRASFNPQVTNRDLSVMAINIFFEDLEKAYSRNIVKLDKFLRHGCDKFKEIYVDCLTADLDSMHAPLNNRLFYVGRFYMDVYSLCRMMRTEGNYYKNIIHYAGLKHSENMRFMLLRLGFTEINIDHLNIYDRR
jgi:hypothetical protein